MPLDTSRRRLPARCACDLGTCIGIADGMSSCTCIYVPVPLFDCLGSRFPTVRGTCPLVVCVSIYTCLYMCICSCLCSCIYTCLCASLCTCPGRSILAVAVFPPTSHRLQDSGLHRLQDSGPHRHRDSGPHRHLHRHDHPLVYWRSCTNMHAQMYRHAYGHASRHV